ncbi:cyclin-dependent kinase inhibitor 1D [Chanos chanos]|uniref:Cyclin-dependent kinase inhibitor 1-like n=1 Tax=Chanos chanos TaxID=29144 RepID=A0A6J2WMX1_CHACN|nr:cyclin-dependent kinase inhibitor 1-like [Chanos chanos]XP_030644966.1 cyclin-dependent kinase inhibitor 1-like [Chanos chanos]
MATASSESERGQLHVEEVKVRSGAVRRNLFGPVDHQQLQQDFQRLLCMSVEVANKRWNFDFQRDRPTQGSVEWEELRCQDVPAFYRSCVVRAGLGRRVGDVPSGKVCAAVSAPCTARDEYLEVRARGAYRPAQAEKRGANLLGVKRKQAFITEFFTVKKRRFLHHKGPPRQ